MKSSRLKSLRMLFIGVVIALAAIWFLGPREPAQLAIDFTQINITSDIDAYLAEGESGFDDITPNTEKRVIWANGVGEKTSVALVYIHGFSASSEEIRPVPDKVAQALGANLYFTRLRGHGRSNEAMAEADVGQWMQDVGEALEIGRRIADKVIVMSTSTGGTLIAAAALDQASMQNVEGVIFISPNFGINSPVAGLLTWPFARYWVPLILGADRITTPRNPLHEKYWNTTYPSVALLPMAAVVEGVNRADFSSVNIPALFYYSDNDQVVDPMRTAAFIQGWGGATSRIIVEMGVGDDEFSHLITGDIVSPRQTPIAIKAILAWVDTL